VEKLIYLFKNINFGTVSYCASLNCNKDYNKKQVFKNLSCGYTLPYDIIRQNIGKHNLKEIISFITMCAFRAK